MAEPTAMKPMSTAMRLYLHHMIDLHDSISRNNEDRAELFRDLMEGHGSELTEEEVQHTHKISAAIAEVYNQ